MINFVTKDNKGFEAVAHVRHLVIVLTTLVLVVYIVVASGMAGWTILAASKEKKVSAENADLNKQLRDYSEEEVLARNLTDRVTKINTFLQNRGQASVSASLVKLDGVVISSWEYTAGEPMVLEVRSENLQKMKDYEEKLRTIFEKVQVEKIQIYEEGGWRGGFTLTGRKKV